MAENLSIVISGSVKRNFEGFKRIVKEFEALGMQVLSPKVCEIMEKTMDFQALKQRHLEAIAAADALYLYDPKSSIDALATLELGWALALGKPIFCKEPVAESTLKFFCGTVASPIEVKQKLQSCSPLDRINPRSSLSALQRYIHHMVIRRGFDNETLQDVFMLMVEEVGELARALREHLYLKSEKKRKGYDFLLSAFKRNIIEMIVWLFAKLLIKKNPQDIFMLILEEIGIQAKARRKSMGIKSAKKCAQSSFMLENELADVFIYLLDLANLLDISLFDALYQKERINEKRKWK